MLAYFAIQQFYCLGLHRLSKQNITSTLIHNRSPITVKRKGLAGVPALLYYFHCLEKRPCWWQWLTTSFLSK